MPATSDTMAHARAPLDGGDEVEESQHGTLPQASVGLARLDRCLILRFRFDPIQFPLSSFTFYQYLGLSAGH
jgi:hypothetical protein